MYDQCANPIHSRGELHSPGYSTGATAPCHLPALPESLARLHASIGQLRERIAEAEKRLDFVLGPPVPCVGESLKRQAVQPEAPIITTLDSMANDAALASDHLSRILARLVI